MNFKAYLTPLLKYWWLILAAAVVSAVSSFLVTSRQAPIYQSTATLLVGRAVYEANPSGNDLYLGQQLANYYADIGQRGQVYNRTMEALGLPRLPQYIIQPLPNSLFLEIVVTDSNPARAQAVANELANQLINLSPTSNENQDQERQAFIDEQVSYLEEKIRETLVEIDAAERQLSEMNSARQISDAQTEILALQNKLSQLQGNYAAMLSNTEQGALNTLSIIENASLPTQPIGPRPNMMIVLAAVIAAAVAAGAAYLLEFLDDTFKSGEEITTLLNLPVLASIPLVTTTESQNKPVISGPLHGLRRRLLSLPGFATKAHAEVAPTEKNENHNGSNGKVSGVDGANEGEIFLYSAAYPRSVAAEEFRLLRINLDFAGVDKPLKSIFVTSPEPNEGKTSVATNLAIVMAQGGKKVILIDADFRRPSVDTHFRIANNRGLSDVFRESHDLLQVTQHWQESNLWIIPTGLTPPNPADLLSSNKMKQILEELGQISDVVIVDGPPMLFPDSIALSSKVDGVIMVVSHAYTRRGTAQARLKQLAQVGARVLGVVLNKAPHESHSYYNSHYHNYYRPEKKAEPEAKKVS